MIQAAAGKPNLGPLSLRLHAAAPITIQAAKDEATRPTFSMVGYTGAPMSLEGFFYPVIVDLTGLKSDSQRLPVFHNHEPDRIVGQTDSVKIGSDLQASGTITGDNAHAAEVVSQAKNGFDWQASIGAEVLRREFLDSGNKATVNGREVSGPMVIARETRLKEISFVPLGADSATSADVAASDSLGTPKGAPSMFETWLQAKGIDPAALDDPTRKALQAAYDAEQAKPKPPTTPAAETFDEIIAKHRKDEERVMKINGLVAAAIERRPHLLDDIEHMGRAAIEAKTDAAEFELKLYHFTDRYNTTSSRKRPNDGTRGTTGPKMLEAALCRAGGLTDPEKRFDAPTLEACDVHYPNGLGLQEAITIAARQNAWTGNSVKSDLRGALKAAFPPDEIRAQGWTTISLPNIFSNVANKFLAQGFNAVDDTWKRISYQRPVNDFKAITGIALTGGFTYLKVGPGGELKHATASELTYTYQAETYGRMMAINRQQIINDDLGALSEIPMKLGRGAALSLNRDFWTVFLNNSSFFTSGRANVSTGAGSALGLAGLDAAQAVFLNQIDPDGDPVAITPKILLAPPALSVTAKNLMNSTTVVNNTTANTTTLGNNPFAGLYQVESSPYMSNSAFTGYSTAAWYLLADPAEMPVITVVFLNGKQDPTVESAEADFNTLGIQFRGFFDYGVAFSEYRGGVRSAGS